MEYDRKEMCGILLRMYTSAPPRLQDFCTNISNIMAIICMFSISMDRLAPITCVSVLKLQPDLEEN